ncbi:hypothetical protein [Roseivirga sp.]|uniref:hypothetical protein n=1 Tax=Roseivirga sp. TaxID=1964215 RepID=UPI002B276905|nr:hypothetical protein [Roseivirga sp.]
MTKLLGFIRKKGLGLNPRYKGGLVGIHFGYKFYMISKVLTVKSSREKKDDCEQ